MSPASAQRLRRSYWRGLNQGPPLGRCVDGGRSGNGSLGACMVPSLSSLTPIRDLSSWRELGPFLLSSPLLSKIIFKSRKAVGYPLGGSNGVSLEPSIAWRVGSSNPSRIRSAPVHGVRWLATAFLRTGLPVRPPPRKNTALRPARAPVPHRRSKLRRPRRWQATALQETAGGLSRLFFAFIRPRAQTPIRPAAATRMACGSRR